MLFSIVFVHGLFGDPQRTWTGSDSADTSAYSPSLNHGGPSDTNAAKATSTHKRMSFRFWSQNNDHEKTIRTAGQQVPTEPGVFWPKELLPRAIPQTRIYTWGYDADINHVFSTASASQATVFQHAGTLLSDIANKRASCTEVWKPVAIIISPFEAVFCPQY
jgi:hypothetical protein